MTEMKEWSRKESELATAISLSSRRSSEACSIERSNFRTRPKLQPSRRRKGRYTVCEQCERGREREGDRGNRSCAHLPEIQRSQGAFFRNDSSPSRGELSRITVHVSMKLTVGSSHDGEKVGKRPPENSPSPQ